MTGLSATGRILDGWTVLLARRTVVSPADRHGGEVGGSAP